MSFCQYAMPPRASNARARTRSRVGLGIARRRSSRSRPSERRPRRCQNRQIAAALFLSDKTIESHLRNVFVKLGASSRMEVALEIDRHRRATAP